MTKRILHLTLKKKWYDMWASGVKTEDYRAIKPYWISRLFEYKEIFNLLNNNCAECKHRKMFHLFEIGCKIQDKVIEQELCNIKSFEWMDSYFKKFDVIQFKNGYGKDAPIMTFEFKGIDIGKAVPEWSDNWQGDVFRIKGGKRLDNN